jgi:hypothetical protein
MNARIENKNKDEHRRLTTMNKMSAFQLDES